MPAHRAQTHLLVSANARHSPGYGCALRLGAWAAEIRTRVGSGLRPRLGAACSPGLTPGPALQRRMGLKPGPTRRAKAIRGVWRRCMLVAGGQPCASHAPCHPPRLALARVRISAAHTPRSAVRWRADRSAVRARAGHSGLGFALLSDNRHWPFRGEPLRWPRASGAIAATSDKEVGLTGPRIGTSCST